MYDYLTLKMFQIIRKSKNSGDNNLASALTIFRGTPGHVLVEDWDNFVYALIERGSKKFEFQRKQNTTILGVTPRVFRVSHPLIIRSGNTVVEEAEKLKDVRIINYIN